jgi:hypothetical protein
VHEQFSKKHGWIDDAGIYVHAKFEVEQNPVQGETKKKRTQNRHACPSVIV